MTGTTGSEGFNCDFRDTLSNNWESKIPVLEAVIAGFLRNDQRRAIKRNRIGRFS